MFNVSQNCFYLFFLLTFIYLSHLATEQTGAQRAARELLWEESEGCQLQGKSREGGLEREGGLLETNSSANTNTNTNINTNPDKNI